MSYHIARKPPTPISRQVRRATEREAEKSANSFAKDAGHEIKNALGYIPDAAEVADIIDATLHAGLLLELDAARMRKAGEGLRAGKMPPPVAYASILGAINCGIAAEQALTSLEALYAPDDVIELRALAPTGGAVSFNGRLKRDRNGLLSFIREHNGSRNLYLSINPRHADMAGTARPASADQAVMRRHVVLDFDNKDAPSADPDWTRTVTALSTDAAMVVRSGNGTHVWFAIDPVDGADVATTTAPLAGAMAALGADNMADPPRIIRLPFTINIPTPTKRSRGAKLALAYVQAQAQGTVSARPVADLVEYLRTQAVSLGLPGKQGVVGSLNAGQGGKSSGIQFPPEMLRAPAIELLTSAIALLPNNDNMDRDTMVHLFHAVKGAAEGTGFEAEARDAALAWAGSWTGSDADHDARAYDGIRHTHTGWQHVRAMLGEHNPAGIAQINVKEAPYVSAAARAAFSGPDAEQGLAEQGYSRPLLDVANDNDKSSAPAEFSTSAAEVASELPGKAGKKVRPAEAAMQFLRNTLHAEFFNAPDGKLWVRVLGHVHSVSEKVLNRTVYALLVKGGYVLLGGAKDELRDLMVASAIVGATHRVFYRQTEIMAGGKPSAAILNLMDADADGIEVTAAGWRVRPLSAIAAVRMTNRAGSLPLPRPVRANDGLGFIARLRRHVPLAQVQNPDDLADAGVQQDAVALMFSLAQVVRPGAVPHLLLSGAQGAGKTTAARRFKSVLDPDAASVVSSLPDNDADLFAIMGTQTVVVVDNVSSMKAPDQIAALATGAAVVKRELYTDSGRAALSAKTSIAFTTVLEGITQRADVRDRMLNLELARIDLGKRRTEAELEAAWENDQPSLLADLLDLAAGALKRFDAVKAASDAGLLPPLPRLADAALIAEAAAQEAGWKPGVLLAAINNMRASDSQRQLEDHPYAVRVRALLEQAPGRAWTGTAQELVRALDFHPGPDWGRSRNNVSAIMSMAQRIGPLMRDEWGIETIKERTTAKRTITLRLLHVPDQGRMTA